MVRIQDTSAQDVPLAPASGRRHLVWLALAVSAVVLLVWAIWPSVTRWTQATASVGGERLRLAEVTRGDFVRDITAQGRVVAAVSPTLYASAAGTLTFAVESGDSVAAGQLLATIDSPEIQNRLLQEQARRSALQVELERQRITTRQQALQNEKDLDAAGIALKAARRELQRAELAFAQGAMTQVDHAKAQDELENAELLYRHAEQDTALDQERLAFELRTAELALDQQSLLVADLERQVAELALTSPVSGIVGNLLVNQKTNVSRNQPMLSVVDLSAFEVEIQVPESYADELAIGLEAEVRSGTDVHKATLVAVSPEIIDNQVTGRLRFAGASPAGLRQNQRLTTRVLLETRTDVVMVQRGPFVDSGGGRVAYVVTDGIARRRPIEIGATSLAYVEVIDGLMPGDTIIISSTDAFDGAETVLINP